jgi:hypothetical protein
MPARSTASVRSALSSYRIDSRPLYYSSASSLGITVQFSSAAGRGHAEFWEIVLPTASAVTPCSLMLFAHVHPRSGKIGLPWVSRTGRLIRSGRTVSGGMPRAR